MSDELNLNESGMAQVDVDNFENTAIILRGNSNQLTITGNDSFVASQSYEKTAREGDKQWESYMRAILDPIDAKRDRIFAYYKRIKAEFVGVFTAEHRKQIDYSEACQLKADLEAEAQRKAAEDERINAAAVLEKQGLTETANMVLNAPPTPQRTVDVPKVKGMRAVWSARILDVQVLFGAYAQGREPIPELSPDDLDRLCTILKLHKLAMAMKSSMKIPGVKVESRWV